MRKLTKSGRRASRPKLQKSSEEPPSTANKRLGEQTRKLLGKHYASKYRVR
jgi:hypothetical protein